MLFGFMFAALYGPPPPHPSFVFPARGHNSIRRECFIILLAPIAFTVLSYTVPTYVSSTVPLYIIWRYWCFFIFLYPNQDTRGKYDFQILNSLSIKKLPKHQHTEKYFFFCQFFFRGLFYKVSLNKCYFRFLCYKNWQYNRAFKDLFSHFQKYCTVILKAAILD